MSSLVSAAHWIDPASAQQLPNAKRQRAVWDVVGNILEQGGVVDSRLTTSVLPSGLNAQCFDVVHIKPEGAEGIIVLSADTILTKDIRSDLNNWLSWSAAAHPHLNITSVRVISSALDETYLVTSLPLLPPDWDTAPSGAVPMQPAPAPTVIELAQEFAAWRLIMQEADTASKALEAQIVAQTPTSEMNDSGVVSLGIARARLTKVYDAGKIDAAVMGLMQAMKFEDDDIEAKYTNNPNFWVPADLDVDTLVTLVQQHLNIDVRVDARFVDAISKPAKPNLSTRLEFLKDLDGGRQVDWGDLVDWEQSSVKAELIKEAVSGPTRLLREAVVAGLRSHLEPVAQAAGKTYAEGRQHWLNSDPSGAGSSGRSPAKKAKKRSV